MKLWNSAIYLQKFKPHSLTDFFPKKTLQDRLSFFLKSEETLQASYIFNECSCLDKNFYSFLSTFSVTWANCTSQLLLCNVSKGMFSGQLDMLCVLVFPASLLCLSAEFPAASKLIKIGVSRRQGNESLCLLHLLDQQEKHLQEKHPGLKSLFIALKSLNFKRGYFCMKHSYISSRRSLTSS